jgi:outer membrane protein assembly factor BamB
MLKKNKWTVIPFIIIATLILIFLYYLTIRKHSTPAEPLQAIPVNASLIIKVNDFNALFEKIAVNNSIWNEIRIIPEFKRIDDQLHFLDSLFRFVPEAEQLLQHTPFFISAHFTGKDRISLMHVLQLPQRNYEKKINNLINGFVINSGTIKIRNYEGTDIHEVALLNETKVKNFSYAFYRDIFMISFSTILLEDAIRQLIAGESVTSFKGFDQMYETAGKNVDANFFINFEQFPRSLSTMVKPEFKSEVRSFKNFAGWAELDVNLLSDMLLMNGFVNPPDSLSSIASLFLSQTPQRITADEILPASVASFLTISLSNAEKYFEDYKSFLQDQNKLTNYNNTLQSLNNAYNTNFPNDLLEIMDDEITLGFESPSQEGSPAGKYFLIRIKSKAQAEEKMMAILSRIAVVESSSVSSYVTQYKLDADLTYKIYHFPINKFTAKIFGNLFSAIDKHYFVILDNYLVFGDAAESLKSLIHSYVLNKTLKYDPAFKEFRNDLSPRSNLCFYCNLYKGQSVYSSFLNNNLNHIWLKYLPVFQKVQALGYQLYNNNGMLYTNLMVKYLESYNTVTQTVWESKLDTLAAFKPVFTVNHMTRQNEVFVQDLNNKIYLINQVGRILWKIQLPDPINSEVFQVDYFRNGKLQLLFSTRNMLYLIDRNGNYIEKYPVKLRSPATCGLSVFDYDGNRDYRLFIACEDNHVYAYTKDGNLLKGWEFTESESEITQPVSHFRIGDKDFLVFGDRLKTYILDRKGNTRINIDTYFPRSAQNNYLLDLPRDGSSPAVVTTDTTGKVFFIGFNGNVKTVVLSDKITNRHYFDYKDLNGDGKPEFILLENDKLTVFNNDQTILFTYIFKEAIRLKPQFYQFSSTDRKLGVVSPGENLIYLFNNNGDLYAGFPLQGNTPFSIGNFGDSLSRFNLVVGSRDNFLYNYRVK